MRDFVWAVKNVPIKRGMDIIAPCLMLGLAFGRIGCFLNGCCYGAECNLPWAVSFPYHSNAYLDEYYAGTLKKPVPQSLIVPLPGGHEKLLEPKYLVENGVERSDAASVGSNYLHPTQLYSAITAFMLAALLVTYYSMPHAAGRVFALMLMLEGGTRFLLEMIRVEPTVLGPLSLSMILGLLLVVGGALMWLLTRGPNDDLEFHPVPTENTDAELHENGPSTSVNPG